VPFCEKRCQFCEYTVVDPRNGKKEDIQDMYFDRLMKEFEMYRSILETNRKKLVGFGMRG
jgi:coproporphyrinogen III oxidase-like Fe-S oxidoreductase